MKSGEARVSDRRDAEGDLFEDVEEHSYVVERGRHRDVVLGGDVKLRRYAVFSFSDFRAVFDFKVYFLRIFKHFRHYVYKLLQKEPERVIFKLRCGLICDKKCF